MKLKWSEVKRDLMDEIGVVAHVATEIGKFEIKQGGNGWLNLYLNGESITGSMDVQNLYDAAQTIFMGKIRQRHEDLKPLFLAVLQGHCANPSLSDQPFEKMAEISLQQAEAALNVLNEKLNPNPTKTNE